MALVFATALCGSAHAQDEEVPVRVRRNLVASFVGTSILQAPEPLTGAQVALNFRSHVALDLTVETLLYTTLMQLGGKFYVLERALTPYVFVRGGTSFQTFDALHPFWLCPGVGLEVIARNAVTFFAEAGPAFEFRGDSIGEKSLIMLSAGIGYRMDIWPRPRTVRMEPQGRPGRLGEPCTPVAGMPGAFVCDQNLICREGRCVSPTP